MAETKKKILIISQYIAPEQAIASNRWTKIAKYLKRNHNVEITVLTNKKNYDKTSNIELSVKDDLLIDDLKYFDEYLEAEFDIVTALILPLFKNIKHRFFGITETKKEDGENTQIVVTENKNSLKNKIIHYKHLLATDIKTKEKIRVIMKRIAKESFDYDVMISTYGPLWPHLVAKRIKKKYPEVFWVADFRDPYAGNMGLDESLKEFENHKRFVAKNLKNADVITKVADEIKLFESDKQKVVTLTNGFDPEEQRMAISPKVFTFLYTGTIYKNFTDLTPIFRAIAELINSKEVLLNDIKIVYAGSTSIEFEKQISKWDLEKVVLDLGILPRGEIIKLQQEAAILLYSCVYAEGEKYFWTGKMYEYMMAGKPIVCLVNGNIQSPQYEYMKYLGGVCYEEYRKKETYVAMKKYVLDKYREWKRTGTLTIEQNKEYINQFSYNNIADKLWKILEKEV